MARFPTQTFCCVLMLMLGAVAVRAEILSDLYSAQVPVKDQGNGALAAGASEALKEVLVKVSGSFEVLDNPAIAEAVGDARRQVQQYAFIRDKDSPQPLQARFEFDPSYVTALVTRAGAPLWTANRPPVLVWLVAEDAGRRYFVNADTAPQQADMLRRAFARRGVPVRFPLGDLTDAAALGVQDAWRLDGIALRAASARYQPQFMAAGRYAQLSSGSVVGDWSYFSPEDRLDRAISADSAEDFAHRGADIVARDLVSRYAVAPTAVEAGGIPMTVVGVKSFADYAGIVSWLESLELVARANLESLSGERMELRLRASADASRLATLIELNKRLQPLPPAGQGPRLSYQWLE